MRNRTRIIAAATAGTVALAGVSTAAALASTSDGKPGTHSKTAAASDKHAAESDLAARLGVSPARLDRALRAAKISLSKANAKPTESQFEATLARILGIPEARVRQAFRAENPGGSTAAGSKAARSKAAAAKAAAAKDARSKAAERATNHAFAAAVARELQVSMARVSEALRPMLASGYADPTSPEFAAAARSLGVSVHQLSAALVHAKQSLAQAK
jgi:hypothetical protein